MAVSFDPTRISFGRRGCFPYACVVKEDGKEMLYLCSLHAGANTPSFTKPSRQGKLLPLRLIRNGRSLDYRCEASTDGLSICFEGGCGQIMIQKNQVLRVRVRGADMVLQPELDIHEVAKTRNDGSWEISMASVKMLLFPVQGTMEPRFSYDVHTSQPGETSFTFRQDPDGVCDAAVHVYLSNGIRMEQYPSFGEVQRDYGREFREFLDRMPLLPDDLSDGRELAAYLVWSHIMEIEQNTVIYMNKGIHKAAFSWQQAFQAIGQYRNPELAWRLISSMFRYQDDFGMLPDCVDDVRKAFSGTKPPLQGLALTFLFRYHDFSFVPVREYRAVYEGIERLVYWWMSYRDTARTSIPQYDAPDESGWDDSSMFIYGTPVATPDLSTYMILAMDALSVMAHHLHSAYEEREWKRRSELLAGQMLAYFRDGDMLKPRLGDSFVECGSVTQFIPLLLGDRLPADLTEAMVSRLMTEGLWLTPYGLAGERQDSPEYRETGGWLSGSVLAPAQLLICLGLLASGRKKEAGVIASRYLRALNHSSFAMIMSSRTGADISETRWGPRYPNRMSWTGMVYLVLGSLCIDR